MTKIWKLLATGKWHPPLRPFGWQGICWTGCCSNHSTSVCWHESGEGWGNPRVLQSLHD